MKWGLNLPLNKDTNVNHPPPKKETGGKCIHLTQY